jgi:hypothetical protein
MGKTNETYELIQSMSPNEKRFFRLSVIQAGKEANYLRVFSAMDTMDEFDQEKLQRKLGGKKLNLSYEKNYLHKQLLRSFRHFCTDGNSVIELLDILKSLEMLYRKRLNAQCQKLIKKGIELCKKYEMWNYHLELVDWQYRLHARTGNLKALAGYHAAGFHEKQELINKINTHLIRQEEMCFILSVVQMKSSYLSAQEKERFAQLRKNFPGDVQVHSFRTIDMMYASQALMHHYAGDFEEAYRWAHAGQELYRNNPQFIADQPFRYFASKGNLINRCLNLEKYEEALQHIDEMKAFIKSLDKFNLQEIGEEHLTIMLNWVARLYFKTGRHGDALRAAKEFERNSNLKRFRPQQRLMADSDLARIYFYNGLYKESLRYVNRQLRDGLGVLKLDFLLFAYLLRLCIYEESKNYELLNTQAETVKRFMKKNNISDEFALRLVDCMKKLCTRAKEIQEQDWKHIYGSLKKVLTKDMEQYEGILYWVRQKWKEKG